jgi:hypothetical protein
MKSAIHKLATSLLIEENTLKRLIDSKHNLEEELAANASTMLVVQNNIEEIKLAIEVLKAEKKG